MAAETTLRDTFNTSDPNRTDAALQDLQLGELMTLLINNLPDTEAGLVPAANVITMATTPSALFDVEATAAAVVGKKKLIKGRTASDGTIQPVPATGEAVWNGGTKVRFNAADAVTAADVKYATSATSSPSYLRRALGEQTST